MTIELRDREWPDRDLSLEQSVTEYFDFIRNTAVNKLAGLTEEQARATPLDTSPVMSCLGLVKHLTAVLRHHVVIHVGGHDLPSLWRTDDEDFEFRVGPDETVASVVEAYDAETERVLQVLSSADWDATIEVYRGPIRVGRFIADVLQESARHLGHLDIVRELVDGAKGE